LRRYGVAVNAMLALQITYKVGITMTIITNENITSKQRSKLRSLAAKLSPITQIGKGGITDNLLKTLSDALDARELIKVTILDNAEDEPRNLAENVAELLEAVCVSVIGRKAIFYRYSRRDKYAHLEI
jgi:RNA-binding protein